MSKHLFCLVYVYCVCVNGKMPLTWPKIVNFLLLLFSVNLVKSSEITFCDGESLVKIPGDQCPSGFVFGEHEPECICIKGIYRMRADNCGTADGFAEEVCTTLHDPATGSRIVAMNLAKDPLNWSQTGVVCEKLSFGSGAWDLVTEDSRVVSNSTDFYVLNGKPYYETKGAQGFICIKPEVRHENDKICKYFRKDNPTTWNRSEEGVTIEVKEDCEGGVPLKEEACFGKLEKKDSECELSCAPKTHGRGFSRNPNSGTNPFAKYFINHNITNPTDYRRHDSKYLNRKMMIHNIISQIELSPMKLKSAAPTYGSPKRTFELFHIMKNITTTFCPSTYVNPDWIDMTVNLFYTLHKGNIHQYHEILSQEEYEWIKSILPKCASSIQKIELTSKRDYDGSSPVCGNGGKATGYCNGTSGRGFCNYVPIKVADDRANASFHWVPDVAWNILDLVHVVCFDSFKSSYRMWHVLQGAAEKLFSRQVKKLWYYPGWSRKTRMKLLGADADMQIHNFEVCIEAGVHRNGKIPRLIRPKIRKYLRRKRSLATGEGEVPPSLGKNVEVYCSRTRNEFVLPQKCLAEKPA